MFEIEIKNAEKELKRVYEEERELANKKKSEIDKAITEIETKYKLATEEAIQKCFDAKGIYNELCQKKIKFSTFNSEVIGKVLAKLLTKTRGEEYIYTEAKVLSIENSFPRLKKVRIIINKKYISLMESINAQNTLDSILLDNLKDCGEILVLNQENDKEPDKVTFYQMYRNKMIDRDLTLFPEIKEFIDYIIEYRYLNNKGKIEYDEIEEILKEYLENKMGVALTRAK